ncbi:unnamed protein product [Closterium sp. NIES-54]
MSEHIDVATLTQDRLGALLQQLHESSEEIAALTEERTSLQNDIARAQQAQSQALGTPRQPAQKASQNGSVMQPASAASDGVVHSEGDDDHGATHPEATNAARSQPSVTISVPTSESTLESLMLLKPQRPACFDPSQRGGPTLQAWLFTMNVFFNVIYVSKDTAMPCRCYEDPPWMVTRHCHEADGLHDYTDTGRTNRTLGLCARFEPIAASIAARQKLRTWRQLGSVQDYTSGFLSLCEQVGYMHESERIERYIGGLKHEIAQEIQLRVVTDFQEILAMADKLDFFRRPRPGSYRSSSNWENRSRGMNSEGLGFESQYVHFGHPSAGGCQRSTGDPRLILGKGYRHVGLGGYGHTDPLLNKPFYPNGLVVGILTTGMRMKKRRGLH